MSLEDLVSRFRPNLVVSGNGMEPYEEDEWSEVTIGGQKFKVTPIKTCILMDDPVIPE